LAYFLYFDMRIIARISKFNLVLYPAPPGSLAQARKYNPPENS